jgi:hypothetical protein
MHLTSIHAWPATGLCAAAHVKDLRPPEGGSAASLNTIRKASPVAVSGCPPNHDQGGLRISCCMLVLDLSRRRLDFDLLCEHGSRTPNVPPAPVTIGGIRHPQPPEAPPPPDDTRSRLNDPESPVLEHPPAWSPAPASRSPANLPGHYATASVQSRHLGAGERAARIFLRSGSLIQNPHRPELSHARSVPRLGSRMRRQDLALQRGSGSSSSGVVRLIWGCQFLAH